MANYERNLITVTEPEPFFYALCQLDTGNWDVALDGLAEDGTFLRRIATLDDVSARGSSDWNTDTGKYDPGASDFLRQEPLGEGGTAPLWWDMPYVHEGIWTPIHPVGTKRFAYTHQWHDNGFLDYDRTFELVALDFEAGTVKRRTESIATAPTLDGAGQRIAHHPYQAPFERRFTATDEYDRPFTFRGLMWVTLNAESSRITAPILPGHPCHPGGLSVYTYHIDTCRMETHIAPWDSVDTDTTTLRQQTQQFDVPTIAYIFGNPLEVEIKGRFLGAAWGPSGVYAHSLYSACSTYSPTNASAQFIQRSYLPYATGSPTIFQSYWAHAGGTPNTDEEHRWITAAYTEQDNGMPMLGMRRKTTTLSLGNDYEIARYNEGSTTLGGAYPRTPAVGTSDSVIFNIHTMNERPAGIAEYECLAFYWEDDGNSGSDRKIKRFEADHLTINTQIGPTITVPAAPDSTGGYKFVFYA